MLSTFLQTKGSTFFADTAEQKDCDIDISGWGGGLLRSEKTYLAILDPETGSSWKTWACLKEKTRKSKDKIGLADYKLWIRQIKSQILKLAMKNMLKPKSWLMIVTLFYQFWVVEPIFHEAQPQLTGPFSFVGHKGDSDNYEYVELQKEPVTLNNARALKMFKRKSWVK